MEHLDGDVDDIDGLLDLEVLSATIAVTGTVMPAAAERTFSARRASWIALRMWGSFWPLIMRVWPATHTSLSAWRFVLIVKTPDGPTTT